MERLFTPWRMAYVTSTGRDPGCVFCGAAAGAEAHAPMIVHQSPLAVVLMNLFPYNSGHVMVAPRRHLARLSEATPEELGEMLRLAQRLEAALTEEYRPDGINVGMNLGRVAGAGIADHMHLHIVPRWSGDTSFMGVVADTRVLPEEPATSCRRLRRFFRVAE
jgi:ATP adenylyltransferase